MSPNLRAYRLLAPFDRYAVSPSNKLTFELLVYLNLPSITLDLFEIYRAAPELFPIQQLSQCREVSKRVCDILLLAQRKALHHIPQRVINFCTSSIGLLGVQVRLSNVSQQCHAIHIWNKGSSDESRLDVGPRGWAATFFLSQSVHEEASSIFATRGYLATPSSRSV